MDAQNQKLKKDLKRQKEKENAMTAELEEKKQEMRKSTISLHALE
jgi:hypothetical protein